MPDDSLLTDLFSDDIKQNKKHEAKEAAKPKPKICIKHSRIEINDYEVGQSAHLEYLFSIYDAMNHKRIPRGAEYDPDNHRLILPRGMNIEMLKRIFNTQPFVDRNHDPYVGTEPLQIKYLARDERQLRILKFLIGAEEYAYTQTKSQLAVNTTTGSGKTFVTVAAMCMKGARMVIITSSVNWLAQWAEKICEYTKLTPKDLYTLSGRSSIERLFTRNPIEYQVFMASHATLHSYADNHHLGWMAIDELFRYMRCEVKVFDETKTRSTISNGRVPTGVNCW